MFFAVALIVVAYLFFRSPLAGAAAEALRAGSGASRRDPTTEQAVVRLDQELTAMREHVTELAERVDFTERMLADVRRRESLPPPRG